MISFFRSIFQSKIGLALTLGFVALIAVAFASSDVTGSGAFGGIGGDDKIAHIGDDSIGLGDFNQTVNNAYNQVRQERPGIDMAAFVDQGGVDEVLNQMIDAYALEQFGNAHDMFISKRLIDSEIVSNPAFRDVSGQFNEDNFRRMLQQQGASEQRIRDGLRRTLMAEQLLIPVQVGARMPKRMAKPYADLTLEGREGEIAFIPSSEFFPKGAIDSKALQKFYSDNGDNYRIPERRVIRYASFTSTRFRAGITITDKDIKEVYDSRSEQYASVEQRDLTQVIAPTEAAAKSLEAKVKAGSSLEQAAESVGLSAIALDAQTRADYTASSSAKVAASVFSAKQGELARLEQGGLGWYVVRVRRIGRTAGKTLAEATPDIRNELNETRLRETVAEFTEGLEDRFANGETLSEIAEAEDLEIKTSPLVFANGSSPQQPGFQAVGALRAMLPLAFQMDQDSSPQLVEVQPGVEFALFDIDTIVPAAPPPLKDIRAQVEADYRFAQGSKAAKALAEKLGKAAKSIDDVTKGAAAAKIRIPAIERIGATRRQITEGGQRVPPPVALLFSMAEGSTKVLEAPGKRGWFVIHLRKIISGDASKQQGLIDQTAMEFRRVVASEYEEQFINAVKAELTIKRNPAAIKAVTDQLSGRNQGN
ncbi:MAG: SurA N-terminal domain-containing protein [Blastomonas sp.]